MSGIVKLCDRQYWEERYQGIGFKVAPHDDLIRQWLERWIVPCEDSCLEIGCFPGKYLAVMGELGYRLFGIDLVDGVNSKLPEWLGTKGYRVGDFFQEDFLQSERYLHRAFDVVCSFGFIEHYVEWPEILRKHGELVRPGGLVVVSAPNFRGLVQWGLHSLIDRDNLAHHNLAAMRPQKWARVLEHQGFEIVFCGWVGSFDFWAENAKMKLWQKVIFRLVRAARPMLRKMPVSGLYAPHCGIIARRVKRES